MKRLLGKLLVDMLLLIFCQEDSWNLAFLKKLLDKGGDQGLLQSIFADHLRESKPVSKDQLGEVQVVEIEYKNGMKWTDVFKGILEMGMDLELELLNVMYMKCVMFNNHELIRVLLTKGVNPDFIFHTSDFEEYGCDIFKENALRFILEELLKQDPISKDSKTAIGTIYNLFIQLGRNDIINELGIGNFF